MKRTLLLFGSIQAATAAISIEMLHSLKESLQDSNLQEKVDALVPVTREELKKASWPERRAERDAAPYDWAKHPVLTLNLHRADGTAYDIKSGGRGYPVLSEADPVRFDYLIEIGGVPSYPLVDTSVATVVDETEVCYCVDEDIYNPCCGPLQTFNGL